MKSFFECRRVPLAILAQKKTHQTFERLAFMIQHRKKNWNGDNLLLTVLSPTRNFLLESQGWPHNTRVQKS